MNETKKVTFIVLGLIFLFFNIIHIYWPIHLIIEDINMGTMIGTNIDLAVIYPWIIEIISLPLIIGEIVCIVIFRKVKYRNVFNLVVFGFYIIQILMFNVLLWC